MGYKLLVWVESWANGHEDWVLGLFNRFRLIGLGRKQEIWVWINNGYGYRNRSGYGL